MKKYSYKALLALSALTLLILLPCSQAVMVSGVVFDPEADPGEHVSHEITVSLRETENATDLTVDLYDWNQTIDGGNVIDEEGSLKTPYSAKGFLKVTPQNIHLEPGSTEKILVEGDIPADSQPGGRYAIISVKGAPRSTPGEEGESQESRVSVVIAYNVLIMIKVRGDIIQTAEITDLSVDEPVSAEQQNVTLTLKNTGNFHYKPDIQLILKDKDGNIHANETLIKDSSIFPPFSNEFKLSLNPESELEPGTYLLEAKISLKDGTEIASKEMGIEIE